MPPGKHLDRFASGAETYAAYRPAYPLGLMQHLAKVIERIDAPLSHDVIDVGAGTGIFTRQLSTALGEPYRIIAVEPADGMRAQGEITGLHSASIEWVKGTAEKLPATDSTIRAVVAATAAHWFDRLQFYQECSRVLVSGGLMAIAEYLRDVASSPAAAALEGYLREKGGPKEARPDYLAEFAGLSGFGEVGDYSAPVTLHLRPAQYAGLALSSSYCRPIVERLGQSQVEDDLTAIASDHTATDGTVPYGYLFRLYLITKS